MKQTSLQYLKYLLSEAKAKIEGIECGLPDALEDEEDYVDPTLGVLDETYEEIRDLQTMLSDALWGAGGYRERVRFREHGD